MQWLCAKITHGGVNHTLEVLLKKLQRELTAHRCQETVWAVYVNGKVKKKNKALLFVCGEIPPNWRVLEKDLLFSGTPPRRAVNAAPKCRFEKSCTGGVCHTTQAGCAHWQSIFYWVYPQEIWLILPVVICLFQGLSHASVRVLGVYLERSVYGSLNGLLSTQQRMCICHPNGITLLTAKLIPVRRTSYLSNSGVTSGLLHCGARCASPKQKPTPFFGSYYC